MKPISEGTTLEELAAIISQTLDDAGITATLSGGGAVSIYSDNEYLSYDLDFVSHGGLKEIGNALAPLGFDRVSGAREFEHPDTRWFVEFPPGPLAFGDTSVDYEDALVLETEFGPIHIVTPTQSVMDRLAAYVHWHDNQARDQAIMVAKRHPIDWQALHTWAQREGADSSVIESVRRAAEA